MLAKNCDFIAEKSQHFRNFTANFSLQNAIWGMEDVRVIETSNIILYQKYKIILSKNGQ